MRDYAKDEGLSEKPRKTLVAGMKAKKILVSTPLLKFYLSKGLEVTKIYTVIEYCSDNCFASFTKSVTDDRRLGDVHPDKELFAKLSKLKGNSAYGSLLMIVSKFENVTFVKSHHQARMCVNNNLFKSMSTISEEDEIFEVHNSKKRIVHDNPVQLGYFILQYAKLKMLEFYYNFLMTYIDVSDFAFLQMDTDSIYLAISSENLKDIIKPEFLTKYSDAIYKQCDIDEISADGEKNWFPRECCRSHKVFDSRTTGLFKLEFTGNIFYGTCSKCYTVANEKGETKLSCKGINRAAISNPLELFSSVMNRTNTNPSTVNKGIHVTKGGMFTYEQVKKSVSYFYCKRKVEDDGVNTSPLNLILCPWKESEL